MKNLEMSAGIQDLSHHELEMIFGGDFWDLIGYLGEVYANVAGRVMEITGSADHMSPIRK